MAKLAAQWSYQLAVVEIDKVEKVQAQLAELAKADKAPAVPDADTLMAKARTSLADAKAAWDADDHRKAYADAQRALRPAPHPDAGRTGRRRRSRSARTRRRRPARTR